MEEAKQLERKKMELEEKRLLDEAKFKEADLELRKKELEAKLEEQQPVRILKTASLAPATIAAIIGLVATGVGYIIQSNLNRDLEREKFQGQLVLKAIETGDPESARRNLRFFVDTGLLIDSSGKIKVALEKAEKEPGSGPVLPSASNESGNAYFAKRDYEKAVNEYN